MNATCAPFSQESSYDHLTVVISFAESSFRVDIFIKYLIIISNDFSVLVIKRFLFKAFCCCFFKKIFI